MPPANRNCNNRIVPPRYPALVQAWRWCIAASAEPLPLNWTLPVAEAVNAALTDTSWTLRGTRRLPLCLHGPDHPKQREWQHEHAFILPEDADGDGLIDHISISAQLGLDPAALRLLAATDRLVLSNGVDVDLVPQRMGALDHVGHYGPARHWISHTAYVPPNDRPTDCKDAAKQLKYEVAKRTMIRLVGSPIHTSHLDYGGARLEPKHFELVRTDREERPPEFAYFFRLELESAVTGPLAFGWSCHRGLGQFVPVA
jgi:CRISPR-associated protein Csb2